MSIESGHVGTNAPKVDEWRDGMVEQVSEYMDLIKDMDAKEATGADTVDLMEQKVEDYRAGRLETYSIDEVRAHCGLSNDQR